MCQEEAVKFYFRGWNHIFLCRYFALKTFFHRKERWRTLYEISLFRSEIKIGHVSSAITNYSCECHKQIDTFMIGEAKFVKSLNPLTKRKVRSRRKGKKKKKTPSKEISKKIYETTRDCQISTWVGGNNERCRQMKTDSSDSSFYMNSHTSERVP